MRVRVLYLFFILFCFVLFCFVLFLKAGMVPDLETLGICPDIRTCGID